LTDFKFGWWTTGRDQAAVNLFNTVWKAMEDHTITGSMAYVFCSRARGEGVFSDEIISLADKRGIPVETFSAVNFKPELRKQDRNHWRTEYHEKVYELIGKYNCSMAVLAGYMWVLSPEICAKVDAINLHPALPGGPTGTWQEVIWKLLEEQADKTGAMMHLVTPELDRGPAVTFFSFPIKGPEWQALWDEFLELRQKKDMEAIMKDPGEKLGLFKKIRQEGEKRELPLIVQTLGAMSRKEIVIHGGQLYDSHMNPISEPLDLSAQVNASIS